MRHTDYIQTEVESGSPLDSLQCFSLIRSTDACLFRLMVNLWQSRIAMPLLKVTSRKVIPLVRLIFCSTTVDLTSGMHCIQTAPKPSPLHYGPGWTGAPLGSHKSRINFRSVNRLHLSPTTSKSKDGAETQLVVVFLFSSPSFITEYIADLISDGC